MAEFINCLHGSSKHILLKRLWCVSNQSKIIGSSNISVLYIWLVGGPWKGLWWRIVFQSSYIQNSTDSSKEVVAMLDRSRLVE